MLELVKDTARPGRHHIFIFAWGIGTLVVAAAGPFGTYVSFSFAARLAFWGTIIVASGLVGTSLRGLAERVLPADRPISRDALVIVLMSLIFTPFVCLLSARMSGQSGITMAGFLRTMSFVALVSLGISISRRLIALVFAPPPERPVVPEPDAELPRLARRLPSGFDGNVIRLNVKDHQVNVVTTEGDYALRLRFGDAVDEMAPVDGFCTHRSHWVARRAVSGAEKDQGKTYLRLVNGDRVPVSRTYMPDLEDAGLL